MRGLLLALLLVGAAGCGKESAQVRDARDAFFGAMARFDEAGMRSAVAPGYLSVRENRMLTIDSLVADLASMQQESLTVHYAFADSAIEVEPPMAWVVFRSRRIVRQPSVVDTSFAIESAVFRRDGGGWRLTLLHSSPIPDGASFFEPNRPARAEAPAPARPATPPARTGPSKPPARR